jgi:hypothetical protein
MYGGSRELPQALSRIAESEESGIENSSQLDISVFLDKECSLLSLEIVQLANKNSVFFLRRLIVSF